MRTRTELWLGRLGSLALVAGVLLSGTSVLAQQLRDELRRAIVLVDNEAQPSEHYWIGVACGELTDALKAQLDLPEGQGVLVDDVVPDSPAAQAGLKKFDVIVSAGDKALKGPQDLIEAVAQAKEAELSVQFVRAGKKLTLTVKPAKRPQQPGEPAVIEVPADADHAKLQEWIRSFPNPHGQGNVRLRMLRPGMVLPPGAPLPAGAQLGATLPDNLSISISKQGKQPAKISVKQGEKSWELTEDKLQELPEDIRPHVERMLGRMPMAFGGFGAMGGGAGGFPRAPMRVEIVEGEEGPEAPRAVRALPAPGQPVQEYQRITRRARPDAGVEQRLDELNKQIRELREMIEKLQKQAQ
ncbi:MAG TPA: PDZ domain-containing protein [Pirellulales bacterium]|nr:PDZ domain-containing protein [Pirellulales bacterium]